MRKVERKESQKVAKKELMLGSQMVEPKVVQMVERMD